MGVFYILITLFVSLIIGALIGALCSKREGTYYYSMSAGEEICAFCCGASIVVGFILLICSLSLINLDRRFERTVCEYENTKALVESYGGGEYANMESLVCNVQRTNNKIAEHKAMHDNWWTGKWYSDKIGNLEPITFTKSMNNVEKIE